MNTNTTSPRFLRALAVAIIALGVSACAAPVRTPDLAPPGDGASAQRHWAAVLERFVDAQGRVDFDGLAANRGDLDAFVAWVAAVSPHNHPQRFASRDDRTAYHLNAYNALSMYNVLEAGQPRTLAGLAKVDFFALRTLAIGGRRLSLLDYENDVIRAEGDARIHFALNCMAVSCPRLPRVPFRAESLDAQLDREARRFFAEARNLSVDHAARTVTYSEILDFFPEDFLAEAPSLAAYASRFTEEPIPEDYAVRFVDYDWRVNRQP